MTNHDLDLAIVGGCGHIGLALGLLMADSGLKVLLCDVDSERRESVAGGRMPFFEEGAEEILKRVIGKNLFVSGETMDAVAATGVIVTIGTPVDEYMNPQFSKVLELIDVLAARMDRSRHIMLRSTVYPGTSQRASQLPSVLRNGVNLSFCPERVVQGKAITEMYRQPQIVSGATPAAIEWARALFAQLNVETLETGMLEAELAKLGNNAWRYIQFATINQLYLVAQEHNADFDEIYRAMTERYPRAANIPRPGFAAGPCLLKDTMQLAAFARSEFQIGRAAVQINEGLPNFLVNQLVAARGGSLNGTKVAVLGMAFKAESDDLRDSLSFKLAKLLRFHGADVACTDPYVKHPDIVPAEEAVAHADVVFVATPHEAYRDLPLPSTATLVDVWSLRSARKPEDKSQMP